MDLTEAEYIKKSWHEYIEELYKKDLHDPDNHEGVITHPHLGLDVLECEVRWAVGSITAKLVLCLVAQACPSLCDSHGLQPTRLLCPWGFSRQEQVSLSVSCSIVPDSLRPHGLQPTRLLCS